METNNILKAPLVSEKMTVLSDKLNHYSFIVDRKANKLLIKKAVEEMYGVTVESVKTMTIPGKSRTRYTSKGIFAGQTKAYKKAIVQLSKGDSIDFFSNI